MARVAAVLCAGLVFIMYSLRSQAHVTRVLVMSRMLVGSGAGPSVLVTGGGRGGGELGSAGGGAGGHVSSDRAKGGRQKLLLRHPTAPAWPTVAASLTKAGNRTVERVEGSQNFTAGKDVFQAFLAEHKTELEEWWSARLGSLQVGVLRVRGAIDTHLQPAIQCGA